MVYGILDLLCAGTRWNQVYIKMLPGGDPVQLTTDDRTKMSLKFSPDGSLRTSLRKWSARLPTQSSLASNRNSRLARVTSSLYSPAYLRTRLSCQNTPVESSIGLTSYLTTRCFQGWHPTPNSTFRPSNYGNLASWVVPLGTNFCVATRASAHLSPVRIFFRTFPAFESGWTNTASK